MTYFHINRSSRIWLVLIACILHCPHARKLFVGVPHCHQAALMHVPHPVVGVALLHTCGSHTLGSTAYLQTFMTGIAAGAPPIRDREVRGCEGMTDDWRCK